MKGKIDLYGLKKSCVGSERGGWQGRSFGLAVGPLDAFVRSFLSDFDAQSLSSPISTTSLDLNTFCNAADVSTGSEAN